MKQNIFPDFLLQHFNYKGLQFQITILYFKRQLFVWTEVGAASASAVRSGVGAGLVELDKQIVQSVDIPCTACWHESAFTYS